MSRQPTPGGDAGTWGTVLNDYLSVALDTDGTIKSAAVSAAGAEVTSNKDIDGTLAANSDTKYASQKATKTYSDTKVAKSGSTMTGQLITRAGSSGEVKIGNPGSSENITINSTVGDANPILSMGSFFGIPIIGFGAGGASVQDVSIIRSAAATLSTSNGKLASRKLARVTTITSSATPTINTDNCDAVTITALATDITSMTSSLSGTPVNFDKLIFRVIDDGTARAITWGASFASRGVTLPATTVASKVLTVGFMYNSVASTWDCIASTQES